MQPNGSVSGHPSAGLGIEIFTVQRPGSGTEYPLRELVDINRDSVYRLLCGDGSVLVREAAGEILDKEKAAKRFLAVSCCSGLRSARAYACRQIVFKAGSRQEELVLRRYFDRVAVDNGRGGIEWKATKVQHSSDCELDASREQRHSTRRPGTGDGGNRKRASPGDLVIGRVRRVKAGPAGKRKRAVAPTRGARGPKSRPDTRESRILLTALDSSRLNVVNRDTSPGQDMADLKRAAIDLGRPQLPEGVSPSDTWLFGADDFASEAKQVLAGLANFWPEGKSPTIDAAVTLTGIKRTLEMSRECLVHGTGDSTSRLMLPPRVRIWREGRTGKSSIFLALLKIGLDHCGEIEVIAGYAHPVISKDFLCPVDSDEERKMVLAAQSWHGERRAGTSTKFLIVKPIFDTKFKDRRLTLDLLLYVVHGLAIKLVLTLEHLGYAKKAYVDGKLGIRNLLIEVGLLHIMTTNKRNLPALGKYHVISVEQLEQVLHNKLGTVDFFEKPASDED